jgi:hypothetical protein
MNVALVVMTDGRGEYLTRTLTSFERLVTGPITSRIIHDDSADPAYAAWLKTTFSQYTIVSTPARSGFNGAMQSAWTYLDQFATEPYVFHLEDDFLFTRPVDLVAMVQVLQTFPHLAQMALRRQPWNDAEREAGGVVEQNPEAYTERSMLGHKWLEHRQFWTTNPSIYPRMMCGWSWPDGAHSEGVFTQRLLAAGLPEPLAGAVRFGYWGNRTDAPWVEHIGHERIGHGY